MKFTTTKAKTIIIVLASLLLFCTIAAVLPVIADAGTPKYIWTGETIADKYSYGQTFAVPERRLDGVQTDVSHTLVFPDGTSSYADEVRLGRRTMYETRTLRVWWFRLRKRMNLWSIKPFP